MPRGTRAFSDRDRDVFLRDAFQRVKEYFQRGLVEIASRLPGTEGDLDEVHRHKFISRLYVHGKSAATAKVWLGGLSGTNSICYYEGRMDLGQDSSMNECLTVEADPDGLFLRVTFGSFVAGEHESRMTKEAASEHLWRRFIAPLER